MEGAAANQEYKKRQLVKQSREITQTYEAMIDPIINLLQEMLDKAKSAKDVKWEKPWSPRGALHANILKPSRIYSGLNQFLCEIYCLAQGWKTKSWITHKGIDRLGGRLLPNQEPVIIYGLIPNPSFTNNDVIPAQDLAEERNEETDSLLGKSWDVSVQYYIWKVPVYNVEQCIGLHLPRHRVVKPDAAVDGVIAGMPGKPQIINENIDDAFYHIPSDTIHLRTIEKFKSKAFYYDTLFHELAHSTGHESRLNRNTLKDRAYLDEHERAEEELVAEFASALLSNYCGISCERIIKNNVEYVRFWLDRLKDWREEKPYKLAIYLSMAKQAFDFVLGRKRPKRETRILMQDSENSVESSLRKDIEITI